MLARTKKVFPGVFVSVMLVAPAYASPTRDSPLDGHTRKHVSGGAAVRATARVVLAVSRGRRYRHTDTATTGFVSDAVAWSVPGQVPDSADSHFTQTGIASWYGGSQWHGHLTSNGERYDQEALTAAHATLPMGTLVRVSVMDGSRAVVVRITDRPGTRRRIIDLSQAAARELGILGRGVAMVRLEAL